MPSCHALAHVKKKVLDEAIINEVYIKRSFSILKFYADLKSYLRYKLN
jgi:hypothetical protein